MKLPERLPEASRLLTVRLLGVNRLLTTSVVEEGLKNGLSEHTGRRRHIIVRCTFGADKELASIRREVIRVRYMFIRH